MKLFRPFAALVAATMVLAACGGSGSDTAVGEPTTTAAAADDSEQNAEATTTTAGAETTTTELGNGLPLETTTTTSATGLTGDPGVIEDFLAGVERTDATSARFEAVMAMSGTDPELGAIEFEIPFGGAWNHTTGDSSFFMDMSAMMEMAGSAEETDPLAAAMLGGFGDIEMRQIGDTVYMKFGLFSAFFGVETEWVSMPADESSTFESELDSMPTPDEMFQTYEGANGTVEKLETGEVNGVQTTHYLVTFDGASYLASLTEAERAELEQNGPIPDGPIPMDIWVSEDGYPVRMVVEIDGSMVTDGTEFTEGGELDWMTMTYDVFDINGDIVIEPPPADQVTPMDDLGGMFGEGLDG